MWKILIITKNYENISNYFYQFSYNKRHHSKFETYIETEFLTIKIYPYFESPYNFRGEKANLLYIEDELYENQDLRWIYAIMTPYGTVRPLSDLIKFTNNFKTIGDNYGIE